MAQWLRVERLLVRTIGTEPSWRAPALAGEAASAGQVAGRIDAVRPVADILRDTVDEFRKVSASLSGY